ncbi:cholestenol delta-isomerase-like protein [Lasiosphaeria miniovina]|uniref:Cholestenol delta-isomerase-like protein n=1 Tax=Lasiosphaeria miniovina TaxID=1954250 RepID=A0AA40E0T9_9PEZI|nr:cholestenol delta-isomerase-like protein [Lasiosphaeria miniovina]KAK0722810.1 cholestenol delta-isomerase-like protein [Lasiosphaeria miniovina]
MVNPHPYYPPHVVVQGYAPNTLSVVALVTAFAGVIAAFLVFALALARRLSPGLKRRRAEQAAFCWFVLCGFLHCFFEGYFVLNHAQIPGSQDLFAQLWKEYALSDSRYVTSDPFMLAIEVLTAIVWGPLSFIVAIYIAAAAATTATTRTRLQRHVLQAVVCVGHVYGVALYYGTCYFAERMQGVSYSRPETLYYWVYYAGLNAPWAVVPALLHCQSVKALTRVDGGAAKKDQ